MHGCDCQKYLSEDKEATYACDFFLCHPTSQEQSPEVHQTMCVISLHKPAGMVSLMGCRNVKFFPAPNDIFAQNELELYQIDKITRLYGIPKVLRHREILEHKTPDKSMYHFCLQEESQPAQLLQEEEGLKDGGPVCWRPWLAGVKSI